MIREKLREYAVNFGEIIIININDSLTIKKWWSAQSAWWTYYSFMVQLRTRLNVFVIWCRVLLYNFAALLNYVFLWFLEILWVINVYWKHLQLQIRARVCDQLQLRIKWQIAARWLSYIKIIIYLDRSCPKSICLRVHQKGFVKRVLQPLIRNGPNNYLVYMWVFCRFHSAFQNFQFENLANNLSKEDGNAD